MWLTKLPHIIVRTLVACALFAPFLSGALQSSWFDISPTTIEEALINATAEDWAGQISVPILSLWNDGPVRLLSMLAHLASYDPWVTADQAEQASNPPTGPPPNCNIVRGVDCLRYLN